nr:hypothetical protein [Tanacetum cinerariifolium]
MEGTGRIFQEGAEVIIEYQSVFTDDGSDLLTDEEWREIGIDPAEWRSEAAPAAEGATATTDPQPDPYFSGRRVLFTL